MKLKSVSRRSLLIGATALFLWCPLLAPLALHLRVPVPWEAFLVAGGCTLTYLLLLVLWLIEESSMSKIVQRVLKWVASAAGDVASYKVYYGPSNTVFDYTQPFVTVPGNVTELSISADPVLSALPEGAYDFAVTAVDDAGNESDFAEVENVPLDVEAPAAPTNVEVVGE